MMMNEQLRLKKEQLIKKLVSHSKAIISNEIGLPLGVLKLVRILTWIDNIEPLPNFNPDSIKQYNTLISRYFIGPDRLLCNKDFLIKQDKDLDKISLKFKEEILIKCFEIIELYDNRLLP